MFFDQQDGRLHTGYLKFDSKRHKWTRQKYRVEASKTHSTWGRYFRRRKRPQMRSCGESVDGLIPNNHAFPGLAPKQRGDEVNWNLNMKSFTVASQMVTTIASKLIWKTHFLRVHWLAGIRLILLSWCCLCRRLWFWLSAVLFFLNHVLFNHLRAWDEKNAIVVDAHLDFHFLSLATSRWLHIVDFPFP